MGFKLWVLRLLRNFQCKLHIEAFIQPSSDGERQDMGAFGLTPCKADDPKPKP